MRLTVATAVTVLEATGADSVSVIGRGRFMLVFFRYGGVARVWRLRGDATLESFERDVARELVKAAA